MSVIEALKSAAWSSNKALNYTWIDAENLDDKNVAKTLKDIDGVIVPGGFGARGIEGKIAAAKFCLKNDLAYLGLCLGLQVAIIAAARMDGLKDANSTEFDPNTKYPVIDLMESQKKVIAMGGTMRLGNYDCRLVNGSKVQKLYKKLLIVERHRHRYEFNPAYIDAIQKQGLEIVGSNPQTGLAEVIESKKNKFFVATQYHPEFNSRPLKAHPLFLGFVDSIK